MKQNKKWFLYLGESHRLFLKNVMCFKCCLCDDRWAHSQLRYPFQVIRVLGLFFPLSITKKSKQEKQKRKNVDNPYLKHLYSGDDFLHAYIVMHQNFFIQT
jgi:hypothetical protein